MVEDIEVRELRSWLFPNNSKCMISDKIEVRDSEFGGRGILSIHEVKAHMPIIKISLGYLLNFSTIIAHITSWNSTTKPPPQYKQLLIPKSSGVADDITKIYSTVSYEDLLPLSSFQIISLYLVLESRRSQNSWWYPFIRSLPSIDDFTSSPLIWKFHNDEKHFVKLPVSTKETTLKMWDRFLKDYETVKNFIQHHSTTQVTDLISKDDFLWTWMCTNSRCLYMDIQEGKSKEDNLTMAPYVDFINHSPDDHCSLKVDKTGFYIHTSLPYQPGEEIFLSYGPHSNELLLCEYGFTLPYNKWNDLNITKEVVELLDDDQIGFLKEKGYYGEYTLTLENISFRTDVALAVLQEGSDLFLNRRLNSFINGLIEGTFYKKRAERILKTILLKVSKQFEEYLDLGINEENTNDKVIVQLHKEHLQIAKRYLDEWN